jgi:UDP-glucose 4-epimerase
MKDSTVGAPRRRVLVLGGTGFIGLPVVQACVETGMSVRALARRPVTGQESSGLSGADLVLGSIEDPSVLSQALVAVDWVIHAVGCPPPVASIRHRDATARSVRGLDAVLNALRAHPGVGLTFLSSGGAIYGDAARLPVPEDTPCRPISAYGAAKLMAEDHIADHAARHGLPVRILRIANAYGPRQRVASGQGVVAAFLHSVASGEPVQVVDGGRAVRDYVHVDDVARAVVSLPPVLSDCGTVNVGSGRGHSVAQILDIVERTTGTRLTIDWLPKRPGDVQEIVLDVSRLRGLAPWRPRDLETGIAQTWQEHLTHSRWSPETLPA